MIIHMFLYDLIKNYSRPKIVKIVEPILSPEP